MPSERNSMGGRNRIRSTRKHPIVASRARATERTSRNGWIANDGRKRRRKGVSASVEGGNRARGDSRRRRRTTGR